MNRSVAAHATALTLALVAAYFVWTREPSADDDTIAVVDLSPLDSVTYRSPERTVALTRKRDDAGDYHWIEVETTPPPVAPAFAPPPPQVPPPPQAASAIAIRTVHRAPARRIRDRVIGLLRLDWMPARPRRPLSVARLAGRHTVMTTLPRAWPPSR